jgi:hypothetical protein
MKVWTDKQGNKLDRKQFWDRWKAGMNEVASSPIYQVKSKLAGTRIMLIGFLCGLVMTLINWRLTWWVAIVLFGGLIVTGSQYIGTRQQYKLLKNIQKQLSIIDYEGEKQNAI